MPNEFDFSKHSEKEMLRFYASVIDELKRRKIVRTRNNPVGDYTEWLVSKTLGFELANNSVSGYDATDADGTRFQIKGRQVTPDNRSPQLSDIRKLDAKHFDYLIAVIFDGDFNVIEAVQIPHEIVGKYASYKKHVNAHILHVREDILTDPHVRTIEVLKSG